MSDTFTEAAEPLLTAYRDLDQQVRELEASLARVRERRNRLRAAAKLLMPEAFPKVEPPKPGSTHKISPQTYQQVREFILATMNGQVFSTPDISRHPDYSGPGPSSLLRVFHEMHSEGLLQLVRRGKGGKRFWRVVQ